MLTPTQKEPASPLSPTLPGMGDLILRISGGEHHGRIIRLHAAKCTIGSAPGCTLRLKAPGVAPLHALILRGSSGAVIRRYGECLQINESEVDDASLRTGDRLRIGPIDLVVLGANASDDDLQLVTSPAALKLQKAYQEKIKRTRRAGHQRLKRIVATVRQQRQQLRDIGDQSQRRKQELERLAQQVTSVQRELTTERERQLSADQSQRATLLQVDQLSHSLERLRQDFLAQQTQHRQDSDHWRLDQSRLTEEITERERRLHLLQGELTQRQWDLEQLQTQHKRLQRQFEQERDQHAAARERLQREAGSHQEETTALRDELAQHQRQEAQTKLELSSKQRELDQLRKLSERLQKELDQEREHLTTQFQTLQSGGAPWQQERKQLNSQLTSQQSQSEQLRDELQTQAATVTNLRKELEQCRQTLGEIQTQTQAAQRAWDNERQVLQARVEDLNSQEGELVTRKQALIDNMNARLAEATEQLNQRQQEISAQVLQLEAVRSESRSSVDAWDWERTRLLKLVHERDQQLDTAQEWKLQLETRELELQSERQERARIARELTRQTDEYDRQCEEIQQLRRDNTLENDSHLLAVREELQTSSEACEELRTQLIQLQEAAKQERMELVNSFTIDQEQATQNLVQEQVRCQTLQKELQAATQERTQLQDQFQKELEQLTSQLHVAQAQLAEHENALAQATEEKERELQETERKLRQREEALIGEQAILQARQAELENQTAQLLAREQGLLVEQESLALRQVELEALANRASQREQELAQQAKLLQSQSEQLQAEAERLPAEKEQLQALALQLEQRQQQLDLAQEALATAQLQHAAELTNESIRLGELEEDLNADLNLDADLNGAESEGLETVCEPIKSAAEPTELPVSAAIEESQRSEFTSHSATENELLTEASWATAQAELEQLRATFEAEQAAEEAEQPAEEIQALASVLNEEPKPLVESEPALSYSEDDSDQDYQADDDSPVSQTMVVSSLHAFRPEEISSSGEFVSSSGFTAEEEERFLIPSEVTASEEVTDQPELVTAEGAAEPTVDALVEPTVEPAVEPAYEQTVPSQHAESSSRKAVSTDDVELSTSLSNIALEATCSQEPANRSAVLDTPPTDDLTPAFPDFSADDLANALGGSFGKSPSEPKPTSGPTSAARVSPGPVTEFGVSAALLPDWSYEHERPARVDTILGLRMENLLHDSQEFTAEGQPPQAEVLPLEPAEEDDDSQQIFASLKAAGIVREEHTSDNDLEQTPTSAAGPTDRDENPSQLAGESNSVVEQFNEAEQSAAKAPRPDSELKKAFHSGGEDEESIESYMQQLLSRVRGEGPPSATGPNPVYKAAATSPSGDAVSAKGGTANVTPAQNFVSSEEYVPRSQAPEQSLSLAAMREVANSQARAAISSHAKKLGSQQRSGHFAAASVALAVGIPGMIWGFWSHTLEAQAGASIAVIVGVYWMGRAIWLARGTVARALVLDPRPGRDPQVRNNAKETQTK